MTADDYSARKGITFEQAESAELLPAQLKLKEISSELKNYSDSALTITKPSHQRDLNRASGSFSKRGWTSQRELPRFSSGDAVAERRMMPLTVLHLRLANAAERRRC